MIKVALIMGFLLLHRKLPSISFAEALSGWEIFLSTEKNSGMFAFFFLCGKS